MSHPEFLFQKFEKSEGAGSVASLPGCGVSPQNLLFAHRRRQRAKVEKWGTAPHLSQRADCPLQSRLASRLPQIERRFEKFGVTHDRQDK
jgi:hypothetical protein